MTSLMHLSGVGCVAMRYGVEEAILLDSMVFWCRTNRAENRNFNEGRWWTYNSIRGLAKIFPWWSEKQIRRIVTSCKEQGALLTSNYNKQGRDRTTWYSASDELLLMYGEKWDDAAICPNGQMHLPNRASASAQSGKPLPCSTHVETHEEPPKAPQGGRRNRDVKTQETDLPLSDFPTTVTSLHGENSVECGAPPSSDFPTTAKRNRRSQGPKKAPDWKPERFAKFWEYYPRGEAKQAAIRAWDKLQPSDELIDTMAQALKRQVASESWQQGIGIPYASTWLNQQRWTDEKRRPSAGQAPPGHVVEEEGAYYL